MGAPIPENPFRPPQGRRRRGMPLVTGCFLSMLYQRLGTLTGIHCWPPPCPSSRNQVVTCDSCPPTSAPPVCEQSPQLRVVGTLPKPRFWGSGHDLIYLRKTRTFSTHVEVRLQLQLRAQHDGLGNRRPGLQGPGDRQCLCAERVHRRLPPFPLPPVASSPLQGQPPGLSVPAVWPQAEGLEPGSVPAHKPLSLARLHVCCGVAGMTLYPRAQLGLNVDGASRCCWAGAWARVADERVEEGGGRVGSPSPHPQSLVGCGGALSPHFF